MSTRKPTVVRPIRSSAAMMRLGSATGARGLRFRYFLEQAAKALRHLDEAGILSRSRKPRIRRSSSQAPSVSSSCTPAMLTVMPLPPATWSTASSTRCSSAPE